MLGIAIIIIIFQPIVRLLCQNQAMLLNDYGKLVHSYGTQSLLCPKDCSHSSVPA